MTSDEIKIRKADHIEIAASGDADFRTQGTLLNSVHLLHQSLPELSIDDLDLSTSLLGKKISAPICITGMTGGTPQAQRINCDLASAAESTGVAFGLGSQRAMAEDPQLLATYSVRDVAPEILLIGNIGAVQAADYGVPKVRSLMQQVGADAIAIHLNPAQEMIQSRGDRNFRGLLHTLQELQLTIGMPVIVKETGCGLSLQTARRLREIGIRTVDVSGAGGTSWVAVEKQRAATGSAEQKLGDEFWDWGLPTAVAVHACAQTGMQVVASGGIRTGLDIARSIALGATAGGLAAPILRAYQTGEKAGVVALIEQLKHSLRTALLLTGCRTPAELRNAPKHIAEPLQSWIHDLQ